MPPGQRCPLGAAGCSSSSSLRMPDNGCPWGAGPGECRGRGAVPAALRGTHPGAGNPWGRRGPSAGSHKPRCTDGFFVAAWPGASSRQTLRLDSPAVATPSSGILQPSLRWLGAVGVQPCRGLQSSAGDVTLGCHSPCCAQHIAAPLSLVLKSDPKGALQIAQGTGSVAR